MLHAETRVRARRHVIGMYSPMPSSLACPLCHKSDSELLCTADQVEGERALRSDFVRNRFDHSPATFELMDLTEFMHGGPGQLLRCNHCRVVFRDEAQIAGYEHDSYAPDVISHLYLRYVHSFREKESRYRPLLRPGARIIEIGSHYGAFLEVAEEWNWQPIGLDVGECTSAFARSRGLSVRRVAVEDLRLARQRAEGIFVWNCFEQLDDTDAFLKNVHRLLEPGGLLVVRVPNFDFYRHWRNHYGSNNCRELALKQLAYNNLLGFPYRLGYSASILTDLLRQYGFHHTAVHDSNVLTLPITEMPQWVREESSQVYRAKSSGHAGGAWIEVVSRLKTS